MPKFSDVKREWMKDPLVQAGPDQREVYSQIASLVRRIRAKADLSQSNDVRHLATELRDQYKEGIFGFSWFDAICVAIGAGLLAVSAAIKLS